MIFKRNIFPFYHTVSDVNLPYISNLYHLKSIDQFQRELDFFQNNYLNISMLDLIEKIKSRTLEHENYFHLSFDDGLKENATIIAQILSERNLDATFFINPNFIGNQEIFYRYKVGLIIDQCKDEKFKQKLLQLTIHDEDYINQLIEEYSINISQYDMYMHHEDIQNLIDKGFTIGAHSLNHPYYKHISVEQQLNQTNRSIDILQNQFNLNYRVFSFPFTDDGVKMELFDQLVVDLTFGTAGIKDDQVSTHIQRIPMDDLSGDPKKFIRNNLLTYQLKKIIGKNIVTHE